MLTIASELIALPAGSLMRLLARSSWQFYRRHPAQLLLSILGIVLGVAIVTAVLITNHSSQRAFALSSEALYGRTTHQLSGALGIDQAEYVRLRRTYPYLPMAPVIQGHVAIGSDVFSILGLDPFSEGAFNRMQSMPGGQPPLRDPQQGRPNSPEPGAGTLEDDRGTDVQLLLQPDALLVSQISAAAQNWQPGQRIEIDVAGRRSRVLLAGTFSSSNPTAAAGLLIGDIAFVQALLNRGERIDRIDLIVDDADLQLLQRNLPSTLEVNAAASRQQTMQAMTRGFHINLTAMSLLALVVGAFLIHNTMTFAVVQRREVFAIKRITGVTSGTLLASILLEALVISLVGSLIGIALGYGVAHLLIRLTTQTINDLYFVLHVQHIWFSPWLIVAGLLLGIGSSVIAASVSALDAAGTSPVQARQRSVIEQRTHHVLPQFALAGLFFMTIGVLMASLPLQSLMVGFVALMLLILGYGLTLPWLVKRTAQAFRPLFTRLGITATLALGGIERNISRTGLAIAALTIAVSATFGVDIMIGSFRTTVDQWLNTTLQSDIYVTAPTNVSRQRAAMLADGMATKARATPGVQSVSTGRSIDVSTNVGVIDMLVVEPHEQTDSGFELISTVDGGAESAWQRWSADDTVMISEPLANKHRLSVGQALDVFTEKQGRQAFTVVAVFRDFGSSHGKLLMSRATFTRYWRDQQIGTLGILLHDRNQDETVVRALRQSLSSTAQPLIIQSNTAIHRQSLAVFDRTFEVTRVLRALTVSVAFVGIFSALLALHLERAREFAIVRAVGASRQQIMAIVVVQTLIMGLLAGLLALPLGWFMSEILIKVINVRSFGWTMHSRLPSGLITETLVLACLSALLAGIYPALRLSRAHIANQLRDE